MKVVLPTNAKNNEIRIAAAYVLATNEENVKECIVISTEELETNIYSDEVMIAIKNGLSSTMNQILSLYARTNACEAVICESFDPLQAVERVVAALKADYNYCLSRSAVA